MVQAAARRKLEAGELTQGDVKELYAKAQEAQPVAEPGRETPEPTAAGKEPDKDTFTIYQLKDGDGMRDYHFEPYDRLQAAGLSVEVANYDRIYTAELTPGTSLEDIYTRFNIDHPKDFRGHSLSVSDIVVLHQNGEDTAHYVDSFGYKEVPEFLQEQTPQITPDTRMTGEQIRTPRGSFSVTDMTAEQMREAGYGLHHTSEDGKYLIMGNGTQAFAVAAEQPEKANPLPVYSPDYAVPAKSGWPVFPVAERQSRLHRRLKVRREELCLRLFLKNHILMIAS